jgi:GAF domain-containing protein
VLVADVQSDPIFVGTAAADILAGAGVRAVQSTPVIGQTGELLGMLSTHYEEPRIPGEQPLRAIESVARRTAFWLEGGGV